MNASAYCLETISRAQFREEENGAQQTLLVEEMELRLQGDQDRVYRKSAAGERVIQIEDSGDV